MAGDAARAESLARDVNKHFPLDTQVQSLWLPAIRAQLAVDRKNPALGLDGVRAASPIELASIPFGNNTSCLYHTYIRGEAYLAIGQGARLWASFRRFSTTAALCGTAGRERWRDWAWPERKLCRRERPKVRMP